MSAGTAARQRLLLGDENSRFVGQPPQVLPALVDGRVEAGDVRVSAGDPLRELGRGGCVGRHAVLGGEEPLPQVTGLGRLPGQQGDVPQLAD